MQKLYLYLSISTLWYWYFYLSKGSEYFFHDWRQRLMRNLREEVRVWFNFLNWQAKPNNKRSPRKIKQNQPSEVWYVASWPTICLSRSKNNWHVHFYCDVLVRGLSLGGLRKQKALRCNQHSQKAQTCLMQTWNAPLCHCQREGKTTTVVSVVDEGGPAAHSLWYAILDVIRETHTWLYWVCVEALQKSKTWADAIFG